METNIMEILEMILEMDMEYINGKMVINMKVIGKMIKEMDKEFLIG